MQKNVTYPNRSFFLFTLSEGILFDLPQVPSFSFQNYLDNHSSPLCCLKAVWGNKPNIRHILACSHLCHHRLHWILLLCGLETKYAALTEIMLPGIQYIALTKLTAFSFFESFVKVSDYPIKRLNGKLVI